MWVANGPGVRASYVKYIWDCISLSRSVSKDITYFTRCPDTCLEFAALIRIDADGLSIFFFPKLAHLLKIWSFTTYNWPADRSFAGWKGLKFHRHCALDRLSAGTFVSTCGRITLSQLGWSNISLPIYSQNSLILYWTFLYRSTSDVIPSQGR